jgi:hypothetical protein
MTTLYTSLSHTVMVFTVLLGNIFQEWIFLCFQAHVHASWWSSHTKPPTLLTPLSQDPFMCPAGSHDIVLGWAQQKTSLQPVLLLFHDVTAVMEICLLCHRLAMNDVFGDMLSCIPLLLISTSMVTWCPLSHCLTTDVFTEPLPSNCCLCWLHNSGSQQKCDNSIMAWTWEKNGRTKTDKSTDSLDINWKLWNGETDDLEGGETGIIDSYRQLNKN